MVFNLRLLSKQQASYYNFSSTFLAEMHFWIDIEYFVPVSWNQGQSKKMMWKHQNKSNEATNELTWEPTKAEKTIPIIDVMTIFLKIYLP